MLVALSFFSCRQTETELLFDAVPEERMSERLAELQNKLTESETGWIATLPTANGGGYGFFMKFHEDQTVEMYADLTDATAVGKLTSTYRTKWVMNASLIFDTYTHLSLLQDPVPSVFGGAAGSGFGSDIEFEYMRSTEDSVILRGLKYQRQLTLVKASSAEQQLYEDGGYLDEINKVKNFFNETPNPYIEASVGGASVKFGITLNAANTLASGKRITLTGLLPDGSVATVQSKFAFVSNGIDVLDDGLIYDQFTFTKARWEDDGTLAFFDLTGEKFVVESQPEPLLPLIRLIGSGYTLTIPLGAAEESSPSFLTMYNNLRTVLNTGTYFRMRDLTLTFNPNNGRMVMQTNMPQVDGGSNFMHTFNFSYVTEGDNIQFTYLSYGDYGSYTIARFSPFFTKLTTGSFNVDYQITSGGVVLGKFTSNDDPSFYFTLNL